MTFPRARLLYLIIQSKIETQARVCIGGRINFPLFTLPLHTLVFNPKRARQMPVTSARGYQLYGQDKLPNTSHPMDLHFIASSASASGRANVPWPLPDGSWKAWNTRRRICSLDIIVETGSLGGSISLSSIER